MRLGSSLPVQYRIYREDWMMDTVRVPLGRQMPEVRRQYFNFGPSADGSKNIRVSPSKIHVQFVLGLHNRHVSNLAHESELNGLITLTWSVLGPSFAQKVYR